MVNYIYIITCICTTIIYVDGGPWANPSQEILDELHDAEIYNAVVTSMNEWQKKQNERKNQRSKRDVPSVCYADVGCFEASGPFAYLDMLPDTPELIGTRFLLYPSQSKRRSGNPPADIPFQNISNAFTWAKQGFNSSLPTKVLIHGFGSDCSHIWVYEMRSALMAVEDVNVICVDWRNGAVLPNYVKATANTRLIGKQLAMLLRGLVDKGGLSLRKIHLIGFSLGAHVAGFAGSEIGNLSRITGLDPAGPLFESQDTIARLDQDDADFVDVIHSNGENLILGGLGSWQPMGHVDFYPNGGRMQKGCSNIFVGAVSDIIWSSAVEGRSLCNHRRAYKFFTDSVSPRCHFPAFPCESYEDFLAGKCFPCSEERRCGNMGYYADRSKGRGQLYLITRDEEPFCAHQYHIKIESSPSEIPIISYGKIQITLISDSLLNETFTLTKKEDEEMRLGSSVERIIVPHPILLEPSKIQILYSAYSGWLTSGLVQWKIDKVTLSDSFGRSVSVCKKNLILDSNIPVILPLFPGECNVPKNDSEVAEDRIDEKTKNYTSKFVPTPVVKIGNDEGKKSITIKDAFEMFNIPWSNENTIDGESEQSRAFNTRVVKMTKNSSNQSSEEEVVEPILKTHAGKSGRSHDPAKPEITEPILGPTTVRAATTPKPNFISKLTNRNDKELTFNFYDEFNESDWIPSVNPVMRNNDNKWKRQDSSRVLLTNQERDEQDALNVLMKTVQFLPRRLARMFEEAEKYTRETILPFVSTYTPRFLSDFISPNTPRYVPLRFDEGTQKTTTKLPKLTREEKSSASRSFNPPPRKIEVETTTVKLEEETPYTNIQKIKRKEALTMKKMDASAENETNKEKLEVKEKIEDVKIEKKIEDVVEITTVGVQKVSDEVELVGSASSTKEIYVNLPIFNESHKEVKYIPLERDNISAN